MEAIILAGGLGTRLQSVIGASPKCMAPVNGRPFLYYVLEYLRSNGCSRVILSLGFKHEQVLDWLGSQHFDLPIDHVIEHEPMGTGGGILLAMEQATEPDVLVLNGDTLFQADLKALMAFHKEHKAATTLALREMYQFERYGAVLIATDGAIIAFEEKQYRERGYINGGIYMISKSSLMSRHLPEKCSFEKDYLERYVAEKCFYGTVSEAYFIDIGIPADYEKAQTDFKNLVL